MPRKKASGGPLTRIDLLRFGGKLRKSIELKINGARHELKGGMTALRGELKGGMTALRGELKGGMTALRDELKGDMTALRDELKGDMTALRDELKGDMTALRGEMKGDMTALRGEMKTEISRLDGKIDEKTARLAVEIVKTQADVREIKESMATKDDVRQILSAIDAFAGKAANYDKVAILHGHALTEIEIKLKDHEQRIVALGPKT